MSENPTSLTLATRGFAVRCQGIEKSFGAAGQRGRQFDVYIEVLDATQD